MEVDKRNRLQNISLWMIIAAVLVNQYYQIYLNHQAYHHLRQQVECLIERQMDTEEESLHFRKKIVEALEDYSEHLQFHLENKNFP